jgi:uncharacterized protein YjiS (DUF1127 family)
MNTAHGVIGLERHIRLKVRASSFFKRYWSALQEWRERERLRSDLYYLNDFELHDIGITRGEIDYVVSNRSIDPRGIRSAGPTNA